MIIGTGVDIVKIKRIEDAINRTDGFIKGVFTQNEIEYFNKKKNRSETIAGFFAAKEAFSKALGTGIRGFRLTDIEIKTNELGKPDIYLSDKLIEAFRLHSYRTHLSISHTSEDAIAFVVLEEVD